MTIPKDEWERRMFAEFAAAAGISVDSGSLGSGTPPEPDIRYSAGGVECWAELVEIADEELARRHMTSLKTGAITGGCFSQAIPLERAVRLKALKTYETKGAPLGLVAYYDKQFPAIKVEPDLIPSTIGDLAAQMVASGAWANVWVYDSWSKAVLWQWYGEPASERAGAKL